MGVIEVDASNACIPPLTSPLHSLSPPLPTTIRGEPLVIDGSIDTRLHKNRPILMYGSGRLIVIRELGSTLSSTATTPDEIIEDGTIEASQSNPFIHAFVYRGHQARVTCAKFSPSGSYVASGDAHGKIRVWSYDNEEHLCKLDIVGLRGPIRDIAWDGDNRRLAFCGEGGSEDGVSCKVMQWDTGVSCGSLGQHSRGRVISVSYKKGRPMRVMTGGEDMGVVLSGGTPFGKLVIPDGGVGGKKGHERVVNCVRYSPANDVICSVGGDKKMRFYDGKTGVCVHEIEGVHGGTVYNVAWSGDGKMVLTCSADGFVKAWSVGGDMLAGKGEVECVQEWNVADIQLQSEARGAGASEKVPKGGMQCGCAFVSGDIPVSVGVNGQITILPLNADIATPLILTGHQCNIAALALNSQTSNLYTADSDGVVVEWDVNTGKSLRRITPDCSQAEEQSACPDNNDLMGKIHRGAISCMAYNTPSNTLLSAGWDDMLRLTTTTNSVSTSHIKLPAQPIAMAIGTNLAVIITVEGILCYTPNNTLTPLHPTKYEALSVTISKDDNTVCVGGSDNSIHIYKYDHSSNNLITEEVHTITNGHLKPVTCLSYSPDGKYLASADTRDVCIFNASDYTPVISKNRWCFHTQRITSLAWSPDNRYLCSGGLDDAIFVWCMEKKTRRVHYPFLHRGGITGLLFKSANDDTDGKYKYVLVSVGCDGCICQWNLKKHVEKKFGLK